MKLSDMPVEGAELVRDGVFDALGLSNTKCGMKLLVFLEDEKYIDETLENTNISCLITTREIYIKIAKEDLGIICVDKPRLSFFKLHNLLGESRNYVRDDYKTVIGKNTLISPLAYIDSENVTIGDNVIIEEFVSIKGHCIIGDNCIIKSGSQIGGSGYEFKPMDEMVLDVAHYGGVIIENNTIIWPQVTIHKAVYPWDNTYIGNYVRINSQSHVDHGVKIGNRVRICAGCIISGRTEVGDNVNIGPGAVITNRVIIGDRSKVSIGSVVTKNVENNQWVTGNFAIEHHRFIDNIKKTR